MSSTEQWLRGRSDAELAELLAGRPDVLPPAPPDFATLARRLDSPATVRRAVAAVNAFELHVLQAVWALGGHTADDSHATSSAIATFLGGPATAGDVADAASHLAVRALLRHRDAAFTLAPGVDDALGRYPGGLGAAAGIDPATVPALIDACSAPEMAIVKRLVPGPPIGSIPADSPQRPTVDALVDRGLLTRLTDTTVALPREVALALRGPQPLGPALATAPDFTVAKRRSGTVDGAAGGVALAARDRAAAVLNLLGAEGAPALKSGGIGIVATRRMAKSLGVDVPILALYLEILHALGMIAPALTRGTSTAVWLPTQAADTFLAGTETGGWALLAATWLDLRRDPSRVGEHDGTDKIIGALAVPSDWRRGPADRRRVLSEIAPAPQDSSPSRESVCARLRFATPLAGAESITALVDTVLHEATELGIVAFDALSTPGRAILGGDIEGAAADLASILPAPVQHVMVQADMTIIAPGRLTPELAAALAEIADVESSGSATVYRMSEASIRRGLDAGATGAEMQALLTTHATSPVPQSVSYLIDDVARRYGVLRVGSAGAVVHSADAALVSQAVAAAGAAGITLRVLAPTVAVSPVDLETLLEALRGAGLTPAAEDAHGVVLDLRPAPRRTRAAMPTRHAYTQAAAPSAGQIDAAVRRMRAAERGASGRGAAGGASAGDIVAVLKEAAARRAVVWIGYADAEGGASARAVEPIVVSGGTMVAIDKLRGAPRTFVLARIGSAELDGA